MKVKDIGLKQVYAVSATSTIDQAAAMMKRHGIGELPVVAGDQLAGVITDRDIVIGCVAAGMTPASCEVQEFMTSNPISVRPDMEVEDAAVAMARAQVRRLPVVEGEKIIGMVSLGDLATGSGDDALIGATLRQISRPSNI